MQIYNIMYKHDLSEENVVSTTYIQFSSSLDSRCSCTTLGCVLRLNWQCIRATGNNGYLGTSQEWRNTCRLERNCSINTARKTTNEQ